MPTLAEDLRARSDADLARLLAERPDLASPAPSSVTAMATRAGTRISVERALSRLNLFELEIAEGLVALSESSPLPAPVPLAALAAGLGVDPAPAARRLHDLALVTVEADALLPVPSLTGAFGPHPAGLGPALAVLDALHPADAGAPDLPSDLSDAPEAARRIIDALTWGPPIGSVEAAGLGPGAEWLLGRRVLRRLSATQLALPREVALAARGGRLLRDLHPSPPPVEAPNRAGAVVGAESAAAADQVVRHVAHLLVTWDDAPPVLVRAGGLAVREVRRLAAQLGVTSDAAAFVVEVAAAAGLIGAWSGGDAPTWVPTDDGDRWRDQDLAEAWARLALGWWTTTRASWLVGTPGERDAPRAALGPGLDRAWAPGLRRRVLAFVAGLPEGAAPSAPDVHASLAWASPRAAPSLAAVEGVLREAAALGLTGAGALAGAGRALLGPAPSSATLTPAVLAAALEADLPPVVDDIVVQGDLTAVVPGRPTRALAGLLDACADVESRGAALTVRFTPESVARALDAGLPADEVLAALRRHARAPLPQPLEYIVADQARRLGALRVGSARSYVRSDDPTALAALLADPRLGHLRLRALAPTVLVSPEAAAVVHAALRDAGSGATLEGPDGAVLSTRQEPPRAPRARAGRRGETDRVPAEPGRPVAEPDAAMLAQVVAAMREGDERAAADRRPRPLAAPAHSLALLQEAAAAGALVTLAMAGPSGSVERRVVRPISVDAGRVRVVDVARLAELTVAVHRIIDVAPA